MWRDVQKGEGPYLRVGTRKLNTRGRQTKKKNKSKEPGCREMRALVINLIKNKPPGKIKNNKLRPSYWKLSHFEG